MGLWNTSNNFLLGHALFIKKLIYLAGVRAYIFKNLFNYSFQELFTGSVYVHVYFKTYFNVSNYFKIYLPINMSNYYKYLN